MVAVRPAGIFSVSDMLIKGRCFQILPKTLPHLTSCFEPFGHDMCSLGAVIFGLNTMSSCGELIGAAIDAAARRNMANDVLKSMTKS